MGDQQQPGRRQGQAAIARSQIIERVWRYLALALLLLATLVAARSDAQVDTARVRQAALATYFHGITAEVAETEVGAAGVPALLELLADPSFARRDNVVALLGWLGGENTVDGLLAYLAAPPGDLRSPDEDRALLLAPQSLGQIAGRGSSRALQALLQMTAPAAAGGVLGAAVRTAPRPEALRDDLLHMALRGLAYSGDAAAIDRLRDIEDGRVRPVASGRSLNSSAATALELSARLGNAGLTGQPVAPAAPGAPGAPQSLQSHRLDAAPESGLVARDFDSSHSNVNVNRLDYANHVNVTNPMTDGRLDQILADGSLRMGRADFDGDVACCAGVVRDGSAQVFGSSGDGLDLIDTSSELNAVLDHSVSRFKVVRAINYCGGTGTNIIGCAWVGGDGAAVVRYGNVGGEGALWVHEYGHNTGLSHAGSSLYIMYGTLYNSSSQNVGLSATECDRYHTPSGGTNADLEDVGVCEDVDGDEVQDRIDNCPGVANFDQLDTDADGVGDACESGCGNGIIDGSEECDGAALGGQACGDFGFDGGSLSCNADCTIDTSSCTECGNGVLEAGEECDGGQLGGASCSDLSCTGGTPSCSASCTLDYASCSGCPVCDNDGICEVDEDCNGCPNDCVSGSGAFCGNGVCETSAGEDCLSCAADCRGKQNGKPSGRFCCGDGATGEGALTCDDSQCNQGEWQCSDEAAAPSCCGDLVCEGIETSFNCGLDCGAPPVCGDAFCDATEDVCSCSIDCGQPPVEICSDGVDNDCDGAVDCADSSCDQFPDCSLGQPGDPCTSDSECAAGKCRGKPGEQTCR